MSKVWIASESTFSMLLDWLTLIIIQGNYKHNKLSRVKGNEAGVHNITIQYVLVKYYL